MTIIEISSPPDPSSQPNPQEGDGPVKTDRAVGGDQTVASSSKINKKVSFSKSDGHVAIQITPEESNNVEQECLQQAKAMFDREFNEAIFRRILKAIWNYHDARSAEQLMPQLIDKYFDELSKKNTANSASMQVQTVPEGPVTVDNEPPHLMPAYPGPIIGPMPQSAADKEDKDLYKAIENSLKQDVPPVEKLRGEVSVGLENVGQTCWFGVIAQVLFHIPKYRKTIYEKTPPEWVEMFKNQTNENFTERDLLVRMRTLFAEMDAGNRKSVDPKPVLDVIEELVKTKQKNQAMKLIGIQQDASELLEYISDWVEKGLQFAHHEIQNSTTLHINTAPPPPNAAEAMASASSEQMECSPAVPQEEEAMVVDPPQEEPVFAVPELPDRVLPRVDGKKTVSDTSALDAWADSPLKDVFHGTSLTRSMNAASDCVPSRVSTSMPIFRADISQRDIHDALANGFPDKSETWFENLPGVLILTLNRTDYDKGISKIHTEFDVPPKLYMDRYLYRNMAVVKDILGKKAHLVNRLRAVSAQLKGYTHYPVGRGEANLKSVLDAARLFFSGEAQQFSTVEMELPNPSFISEEDRLRFLHLFDQMGQNCVPEENEFRRQRDELLDEISQLFERTDLHQEEYILYAVVIHEGEANLGHYYTCIRGDPNPDNREEVWQKFNDRTVDIVSWEQIQLEAGGRYKTGSSAYCLVYVRANDGALHSDAYVPFRQRIEALPQDLAVSVAAKNSALCDDINRYDEKMQVAVPVAPLQKACTWFYDTYDHLKEPLSTHEYSPGLMQHVPDIYRRAFYLFEQSAHFRRKEPDHEADIRLTLLMTGNCHLRSYLNRKFPELKPYKTVQEAVDQLQMSPEEMKSIYEMVVFEWPMFHYAKESKDDVRMDVLSFWRATGIGLPTRVFRFIVLKILSMSRSLYAPLPPSDSHSSDDFKFLEAQANQELAGVPVGDRIKNTSWEYYYAFYLRIMGNYSLVKHLWGLTKFVLRELYTAKGIKFDANAANDYVDAWMKPLKFSFLALRIYYTVREDLELQAAGMNSCIDPNVCIMEQSLLRGTMLYSFLKLFDFVADMLVKCREQRNEAQSLLDSQMFNHICAALNQISKWSKEGCEMSQKVIASVTECLNCARDVLQDAGGPAVTVIKNLYHAIDPATTLTVTPQSCGGTVLSMESEINEAKNIRLELGLSDDQDAMCTVARLLEDISAAISRFFQ